MPEISDPKVVALLVGFVVFNTAAFGVLVGLFRPGDSGFFALNGEPVGWGLCLAASLACAALSLFELPFLVLFVVWWVVVLLVFRLTMRQGFKLNIALSLLYWVIVFVVAALH